MNYKIKKIRALCRHCMQFCAIVYLKLKEKFMLYQKFYLDNLSTFESLHRIPNLQLIYKNTRFARAFAFMLRVNLLYC